MEISLVKKKITTQGDIKINRCLLYEESKSVCAIVIETSFRYCYIMGYGSDENDIPSLIISATEDSDYLTEICFPEYKGWTFFCSEHSKFDIHACLIKH